MEGCLERFAVVALVCLVLALGVLGAVAAGRVGDAMTEHERAAAEREWARVAVVEAQASRDREASLHREQMFILWSVALASFSRSNEWLIVALSALLGAGAGAAVIRWLGGRGNV